MAMQRTWQIAILGAVSLLGIGLATWIDEATFAGLHRTARSVEWIARVRLPSLLVALVLLWCVGEMRLLRFPSPETRWNSVVVWAALWLVPSGIAILAIGMPPIALPRVTDKIAFLASGLLVEEVLFRGVLLTLAIRVFPSGAQGRLGIAVMYCAVVFGVSHIQYYSFRVPPAAMVQIATSALLGMSTGVLRTASGSLWPGALVHMISNGMFVLAQARQTD